MDNRTLYARIMESVRPALKRAINEEINPMDIPTGDFYKKNAWWKQQVLRDFPGACVSTSRDWKATYDELAYAKQLEDKAREKREKERAKREKAELKKAKQHETAEKRRMRTEGYTDAVLYTFTGDDMYNHERDDEAYLNFKLGKTAYSGITRIPLILKSGMQVTGKITGDYNGDERYTYGEYADGGYKFSGGWCIEYTDIVGDTQLVDIQYITTIFENSIRFQITKMEQQGAVDGDELEDPVDKLSTVGAIKDKLNSEISRNLRKLIGLGLIK